MKLIKLEFRNIGKYGNNLQTIKFMEAGSLNLITGKNGNGKCVAHDTNINIKFNNSDIEELFLQYIEEKKNKQE